MNKTVAIGIGMILSLIMIISASAASPQEQLQDSRLTNLEINDTVQQINNSEQQSLINGLVNDIDTIKTQIISLLNRVTNLEDNATLQSRTYVLGKDNITGEDVVSDGLWHETANWTFYLPVDSSVYVESSGAFYPQLYLRLNMGIDSEPCSSTDGDNCLGPNIREYYQQSTAYQGYQISKVYFLTKGYHTIYLQGKSSGPPYPPAKIRPINFNVIASENKGAIE